MQPDPKTDDFWFGLFSPVAACVLGTFLSRHALWGRAEAAEQMNTVENYFIGFSIVPI